MMANPVTPTPKTDWPKAFKDWAAGRTGFTPAELIDIFTSASNLTAAERKTLEGVIKPEPPNPPTPKPTTPPTPAPPKQPTVKPELLIARTPYPKWWKENITAPINILGPATQIIVAPRGDVRVWVATIALTVSGETEITFTFGTMGLSGAMKFGGENEPRGMVIAMGNSPASCGTGGFSIYSSGSGVSVGGFVTAFLESTKETEIR